MNSDLTALQQIPGIIRMEEYDREALGERLLEMTHAVYPHDDVYGPYCTIQEYIDCPPEEVFEYMANPYSLLEWTYSVRSLEQTDQPGLLRGVDSGDSPIYCKVEANRQALTVDYHCAWDQGDELWMIYLNRIVPAELVLKKRGSVVIWTNCRHPYYDANPFPELVPKADRPWVGEWWPLFFAGHTVEMSNLKAILEYRHRKGLPLGPILEGASNLPEVRR
ncbi:MAG: SRPBCC family protein [Deltaproteobacteria bacterium]|nr:SRPBCC family protein [Deltaproteobacteria bacterium]